jgi:hypothetical protein
VEREKEKSVTKEKKKTEKKNSVKQQSSSVILTSPYVALPIFPKRSQKISHALMEKTRVEDYAFTPLQILSFSLFALFLHLSCLQ